ncbi:MAG: chemotaxis response regulator protein-glutamate methylesterase [Clostridia bacterium]|nr:chemotaxis response regulator protein-glutamate methylesterase [Clostridia bacterium]
MTGNIKSNSINVLVVDDSAFMRRVISDILSSDSSINVIDTAKNGGEAIEKIGALKPDVVTMDIEMPVMDGLSCLKEVLKTSYVPVIMLSSLTRQGAEATIQALEYGAVDFITKPTNIFDMKGEDKKLELIDKIKIVGKTKRSRRETNRIAHLIKPPVAVNTSRPKEGIVKSNEIKNIVAIGTSTGGPKALQSVIPLVPGDIPAAFLIVQHMPPGFTKSLAERLNGMSELTVKEAEDGDVVQPGHAYIAPGDYHMLLDKGSNEIKIKLSKTPPVGGHRPAVNVMMESLSQTGLTNIVGVIMTGMGGDGSEGVKKLKNINKAHIIAQDEKTCVVYGMPKVAVQTGAVDVVVPLQEITNEIMKIVGVHK